MYKHIIMFIVTIIFISLCIVKHVYSEDDPLPQRSELAELGNALVASVVVVINIIVISIIIITMYV